MPCIFISCGVPNMTRDMTYTLILFALVDCITRAPVMALVYFLHGCYPSGMDTKDCPTALDN